MEISTPNFKHLEFILNFLCSKRGSLFIPFFTMYKITITTTPKKLEVEWGWLRSNENIKIGKADEPTQKLCVSVISERNTFQI